ncbi:UNVERIFIED_CONTAM: hypothetical protein GTU68_012717 [Idotea baltica]|nr:hypothetical protein [Idotea baltica]
MVGMAWMNAFVSIAFIPTLLLNQV